MERTLFCVLGDECLPQGEKTGGKILPQRPKQSINITYIYLHLGINTHLAINIFGYNGITIINTYFLDDCIFTYHLLLKNMPFMWVSICLTWMIWDRLRYVI